MLVLTRIVVRGIVLMAVRCRAVEVAVLVDEVHGAQQCPVVEDAGGGPSATMRCSSENTRQRSASGSSASRSWVASTMVLPAAVELDDEVDEPVLGAGIEGGRGLVEQQHLGVHHRAPTRSRPASSGRPTAGTGPGRRGRRCRAWPACRRPVPRPRPRARPMFSGPNAISSRTVGENTWASEFWKMNPTRDRKPWLNCSSSRRPR